MDVRHDEEVIQKCKKYKGNNESLKHFIAKAVKKYVEILDVIEGNMDKNNKGWMEKNDRERKEKY